MRFEQDRLKLQKGARKIKKVSSLFLAFRRAGSFFAYLPKRALRFRRQDVLLPQNGDGAASEMEQSLKEYGEHAKRMEELDRKIILLQQSTKTSIKSMSWLHTYLCMRSRLYHRLHIYRFSSQVNYSALAVVVLAISFAVSSNYTNWMGPKISTKLAAVSYIQASEGEDSSLFTGDNGTLKVGFSSKEEKTVGMNVILESKRIPDAENYQLSMNLLSDNLNVSSDQQLGEKKVNWINQNLNLKPQNDNPKSKITSNPHSLSSILNFKLSLCTLRFAFCTQGEKKSNHALAQDQTAAISEASDLPSNTVVAKEITSPGPEDVIYQINDLLTVRYHMEESKTKEYIVIKDKSVLQPQTSNPSTSSGQVLKSQNEGNGSIGADNNSTIQQCNNCLSFSLNAKGLVFVEDQNKDGSWQAYREEDKDKLSDPKQRADTTAVFRLMKPTIEDKEHHQGKITMSILDAQNNEVGSKNYEAEGSGTIIRNSSFIIRYEIDPNFIATATYPIFIDPTISPSGNTRTWDNDSGDGKWDTAANWSADTAPVAGDAVVFDSTSYDPATMASDTGADDLYSLTIDNNLDLTGGGNLIRTSATDTDNHFIYYSTYEQPARVIKINTTTNKPVAAITLNNGEDYATSSVIANGFLYIGTTTSPGKVVKIDLSTFTRVSAYTASGNNNFRAITADSTGSNIFVGTDASPARILKIQTSDMTLVGTLKALTSGYSDLRCAFSDGTYAYFGANTSPARAVKVTMGDLTQAETDFQSTSGENAYLACATDGAYGYFADYNSNGAKMTKVTLSNMTQSGSTTSLNSGERYIVSAAIDTSNGFVYFGTYTAPAIVAKVQTSDMTRNDAKVLNTGENSAFGLGIDGTALLAGTWTSAANSVTLTLSPFSRSGVYTINSTTLDIQKHGIHSNDISPDNYKWDMETLDVKSGSIVIEGDTTVNVPLFAGDNKVCDGAHICGRGLEINANDITVAAGATINADGKGFTQSAGPGAGGSYGGRAEPYSGSTNGTYGSYTDPSSLGSGGTNIGSNGGGAIKLTVSGNLVVDGTVSVNGTGNSTSGSTGGSGGSVNITANNISGTGKISARGGNTTAGGGGGRISFITPTSTFTGSIDVSGATTSNNAAYKGRAGTVYFGDNHDLVLGGVGNMTSLTLGNDTAYVFSSITVNSGGVLTLDGNKYDGGLCNGINCGIGTDVIATDITVNGTGVITADYRGYGAGEGPGKSTGYYTSGSYGGYGWGLTTVGPTYGSATQPTALGSGGNAVSGGAIKLTVSGTLRVDGSITANGGVDNYGGGSGGSIWLNNIGTLTGSGTISANGSTGNTSGGGGGRIAIYTTANNFSGTLTANGGGTALVPHKGTAGTIYFGSDNFDLVLGGAGNMASLTLGNDIAYTFSSITINDGGTLTIDGNPYNGLNCPGVAEGVACGTGGDITVTGNVTTTGTGKITADGKGFASGQGPGGNPSANKAGTYGGRGGDSVASTYGLPTAPVSLGSGGYYYAAGNNGGGAIKLTVNGTLNNSGAISANGVTAGYDGASGDSVWITAGALSGNGTISANGANASNQSYYGGGGGRIAISATTTTFSGNVTVNGGSPGSILAQGRTGTIVLPSSLMGNSGDLVLDNSGNNISSLTLGNDIAYTFRNITIGNGGSLVLDGDLTNGGTCNGVACGTGGNITVTNNLTITGTGSLNADGKGFVGGLGPGGPDMVDVGGTYGGLGGGSTKAVYGSSTAPAALGSSGYYYAPIPGGGALKVTVNGTLSNDGTISTNGANGLNHGGASGGSVWIITGGLTGNGYIYANGGLGGTKYGGGGGRIAVYAKGIDTFTASHMIAGGGTGTLGAGAAGTVVTQHTPSITFVSPADSATNVTQNPTVSFTVSDPDSTNDWMRVKVEIATDAGFTTNHVTYTQADDTNSFAGPPAGALTGANYDGGGAATLDGYQGATAGASVSGTFAFSSDLTQGATYYLRLSSCDPGGVCGSLGEWSTPVTRSFTIAPITKLIYTTDGSDTTCTDDLAASPKTTVVHQVSTVYKVQVCNAINEAVKMTGDQVVNLTTTGSGTHHFSTQSDGGDTVTSITIANGSSSGSFYYYDETVGTPTIAAAPNGQGWTTASRQDTIKSDAPYRLTLALSGSPVQVQAGSSLTATVTSLDQYGNTATDFTGDKSLVFFGANAAPNYTAPETTASPTVTDKTSSAIPFGSTTTTTFTSGVSSSTLTMVLKKTEGASLKVSDYTGGSEGINNQTPSDTRYSIRVIPGDLNKFQITDYPQASGGQFATAGFPWSSTGLAGGSQAPYDPQVSALDKYENIKYDYVGKFFFTMDPGMIYSFPVDSAQAGHYYTFTWNGDHTTHPVRETSDDTYDNGTAFFNSSDFTVNSGGDSLKFYLNGDDAIKTTAFIKIRPAAVGSIGVDFQPSLSTIAVDTPLTSNVVVTAYDVLGNVKTDYEGTVYFTSTDTLATLPYKQANQYTFTLSDNGSKSFTGSTFAFGTGGNHTLTVHDDATLRGDNTNLEPASTSSVVVPIHPVSNLEATAGHQTVTLSWRNPVDPAISKVNIYKSTSQVDLGAKVASPTATANTDSQYTVSGLSNGTTYYFRLKSVHKDPLDQEIEGTQSAQVSAVPADIAPRDVTASEGSDGKITVTYGLRYDSTITLSYYNPTTAQWKSASASTISGDYGAGISGSINIDPHTLVWTPSQDFPNQFFSATGGMKIKVNANAQGSNASTVSNNFLFDTNPPHKNSNESFITVDATGTNTANLTLFAREDGATEQAIQFRLSNDQTTWSDWTSLTSKPLAISNWQLADSPQVYVQYKDPYSNVTTASNTIIETPQNFKLKDGSDIDSGDYRIVLIWSDPTVNNFSKYIIERSTDNTNWGQVATSTTNGYLNTKLTSTTKYYYRVKSEDTLGNISRPTPVLSSTPGAAPDVTAKPVVTMYNWKQEYGVRAKLEWDTDQLSDSFVVYSKKPLASGSSALNQDGSTAQMVGQLDKDTHHEVLVQQLDPSTIYYFKTLSQNEIKITGASEVISMETPARIPLVLAGLEFKNTTPVSTDVVWTTNKPSTTVLEYGKVPEYGAAITDKNLNINHQMTLSGLESGVRYHLRVHATDADENTTESDDYLISIPAIPTIEGVQIQDLHPTTATISWTTNVNTDSQVEFGPNGEFNSQQGKSDMTTLHSVQIIGLNPAISYSFRVRSADQFGNITMSDTKSFQTPADTTAPTITNVKSEITTSGSGDNTKIMAIISFDTDEPSTSEVEYGMGMSGEYPNKTDKISSLNMSHTIIIPDLKPNASYQYRIVSSDASNNTANGDDLTLITPTKEKSLLQMVVKSLEETFSWTKKLKDSRYIKPIINH